MLRVLRKKTLAALFAARHARTWLAIRATSLFNSSGSKVAKQVARFTVPQVRDSVGSSLKQSYNAISYRTDPVLRTILSGL